MDDYRQFVRRFEDALGVSLPAPAARSRPPPPAPDAPVVLLFSPHPDDEVITGALPLRLQREAGARIVNVAVTLGSNPARRDARRRELESACAWLGWELEIFGWPGVTSEVARNNAGGWQGWAGAAAQVIQRVKPRWVFYPHANDWHPTHRGTHSLAEAALAQAGATTPPPWRVQTEYWHPLENPNLLVECAPDLLAELVAALCCHQGEIARNPYHLTLPAWMMDNVRRGAERVAGPGKAAPAFKFGTLYRVEPVLPPGWNPILSAVTKLQA